MTSSIRWENTLSDGLRRFSADVQAHTDGDLADAARVTILPDAVERVPKQSGHLAETGEVDESRGGANTIGIKFSGPYARWIHEHLWFKHPRGGEPKYLESALVTKGRECLRVAGERLWRRA